MRVIWAAAHAHRWAGNDAIKNCEIQGRDKSGDSSSNDHISSDDNDDGSCCGGGDDDDDDKRSAVID